MSLPDSGAQTGLVLQIFARCPDHGRCKTRLGAELGAAGALEVHRRLVQRTLEVAGRFHADNPVQVQVWSTGEALDELRELVQPLCPKAEWFMQPEGDLGERLQFATHYAFEAGAAAVVVIGTDCPALTPPLLVQAYEALQAQDVVLGPAIDGGYYLIGLKQFCPAVFTGIEWSTARVLEQTTAILNDEGMTWSALEQLSDVDVLADLTPWVRQVLQLQTE